MATYYMRVDGTAANKGAATGPGSTQANCMNIAVHDAETFSAGDIIILCDDGGDYTTRLDPPSSGTSGNPITYEAESGDAPTINMVTDLREWDTAGNWTDGGGDVWYIGSLASDPGRLWIDGTEYSEAQDENDIDSSYRWWWDNPNDRVYVYSTSNPADNYSTMDAANYGGAFASALRVNNKSFLTFEGITFKGGLYTLLVQTSSASEDSEGIIFDDCRVEDSGQVGIQIKTWDDAYDILNGEIKNCTIDNNDHLTLDYNGERNAVGVQLDEGSQGWKVYNNTIRDWAHNAVRLNGISSRVNQNNEIYENLIDAPGAGSGMGDPKALAFGSSAASTCINNKFYRNFVTDMKTKINLSGSYNEVFNNVFGQMISPPYDHSGYSYHLSLTFLSTESHHNKIYDNVFYGSPESGIYVSAQAAIANNEVTNNIFMNCGEDSYDGDDNYAVEIAAGAGGNIYRNNLFYKSGVTDFVRYRGADLTVTEFNAENGNNGDTVSGNITGDPLFTNPASEDFTLQGSSPAINVGIDLGDDYTDALNPSSSWPDNVATLDQDDYGAGWEIGAYVFAEARGLCGIGIGINIT